VIELPSYLVSFPRANHPHRVCTCPGSQVGKHPTIHSSTAIATRCGAVGQQRVASTYGPASCFNTTSDVCRAQQEVEKGSRCISASANSKSNARG